MSTEKYRPPSELDLTEEELEKVRALGFTFVAHDPPLGYRPFPRNILTPAILASLRKRWAEQTSS
jgi:hypothetical protein